MFSLSKFLIWLHTSLRLGGPPSKVQGTGEGLPRALQPQPCPITLQVGGPASQADGGARPAEHALAAPPLPEAQSGEEGGQGPRGRGAVHSPTPPDVCSLSFRAVHPAPCTAIISHLPLNLHWGGGDENIARVHYWRHKFHTY